MRDQRRFSAVVRAFVPALTVTVRDAPAIRADGIRRLPEQTVVSVCTPLVVLRPRIGPLAPRADVATGQRLR